MSKRAAYAVHRVEVEVVHANGPSSTLKGTGTAFLIGLRSPDLSPGDSEGGRRPVIVTCSHVIPGVIKTSTNENALNSDKFKMLPGDSVAKVTLYGPLGVGGQPRCVHDVTFERAIPCEYSDGVSVEMPQIDPLPLDCWMQEEWLASKNDFDDPEKSIVIGRQLSIIGYPGSVPSLPQGTVVRLAGAIASFPEVSVADPNSTHAILATLDSIKGMSGAPVFADDVSWQPGPGLSNPSFRKRALIGVNAGRYQKTSKSALTDSGLAYFFPSWLILDRIDTLR